MTFLKKSSTLLLIVLMFAAVFGETVYAAFASWGDTSLVHGCVGSNGNITIVDSTASCAGNETQVTFLKDVDAGSGLSLSRSSSGATLSLDDSQFQAFQVDPTDAQTATSSSWVDMTSGTQSITLGQKSIVQVNAHANAYTQPVASFDISDFTSNNNDLTNNGGVSAYTASLPFGNSSEAADFESSSSQYLSTPDSTSLSMTGDLTIEAWVKFESKATNMVIVGKMTGTSNQRSYVFNWGPSGTLLAFATSTDGTAGTIESDSVTWDPALDTWYHVAVAWNAGSDVKFYVNGVQQGATQTVTNTSIYDSTEKVMVGAYISDSPDYLFDGQIDDVRIWNDIRTQTEINDNKSDELTGSESGLVAYYPFEGHVGNTLGYIRTTYDSGGADTEIGQQGYTGVTTDGQSISAGGVAILNAGTYTVALQKKVGVDGATATYNDPGMSIVVTPTQ